MIHNSTTHARFAVLLRFVVLALAPVPTVIAQCDLWSAGNAPAPRYDHAMAYDSRRGVTVLFGGTDNYDVSFPEQSPGGMFGDTWEHDGTAWRLVAIGGPAPRASHAMCYDSARGVTVLYGGSEDGDQGLRDTWEWDGTEWTLVDTNGPELLLHHAMAFDAARGVSVMYGGGFGFVRTWTWNGVAWTELNTSPNPGQRTLHSMSYDSDRQVIVLFGNSGVGGPSDTWEWNGSAWTRVSTTGPSRRAETALVYDSSRGVTLLYGGAFVNNDEVAELWSWDGATWTQLASNGPPKRQAHAMAFDTARGAALMFGGADSSQFSFPAYGDTWILNASGWSRLPQFRPAGRHYHAMAYDSARRAVTVFGGQMQISSGAVDEFLTRSGEIWSLATASGPAPRWEAVMAFDADRQTMVLFGGRSASGVPLRETWDWNGNTWTLGTTTGPTNTAECLMAYDRARGCMVLFEPWSPRRTWERIGAGDWVEVAANGPPIGGTSSLVYHETRGAVLLLSPGILQWNGVDWVQVAPSAPTGAGRRSAVYDSARDRIVLRQSNAVQEWDGVTWTQIPASGPSSTLSNFAMAYDADLQRTVLYGGRDNSSTLHDETWEWDGAAWSQPARAAPGPRARHALTFDSTRGVFVAFGGEIESSSTTFVADTWEFDGDTWRQRDVSGPGPRRDAQMVFDRARGVCVLWGGQPMGGNSAPGPWEWDGAQWTLAAEPPPSGVQGILYHDRLGMVLFFASSGLFGWNGQHFEQISSQYAGFSGRIAYDAWRDVIVNYFGTSTYEYDFGRSQWIGRPASGPVSVSQRERFELVFDYGIGRTLLITRSPSGNEGFLRIWGWNGAAWTLIDSDRTFPWGDGMAAAFADETGSLLLSGGRRTSPSVFFENVWQLDHNGLRVIELPLSQRVQRGETVEFAVEATGYEPIAYQWRREGVAIIDGGRISGATSPTLRINSAEPSDSGTYTVTVGNECDEIETSPATLFVPPGATGTSTPTGVRRAHANP